MSALEVGPQSRPEPSGGGYSDETRQNAEMYSAMHRGMVCKDLHPGSCAVCAHIAEHGWTGLDGATHCRGCCAVWGGSKTIHCVMCHRTFSNIGNLERHQTTYRDAADELRVRCHDPAKVVFGKERRHYFGEPQSNLWGVLIWRKVGTGRPVVTP